MLNRFSTIDLSQLPAPQAIEPLDYEGVLAEIKAWVLATWAALQAEHPALPALDTLDLESEPVTIVLEAIAYREILLRGVVNDKAKALLLAFATGRDLDHIAATYGVTRQVVTPADPSTVPATAAVMETDDRFRARIQLAPDAFSTVGPWGAYVYWALTTDPGVADANAMAPGAAGQGDGRVNVFVAGPDGQPVSDAVMTKLVDVFARNDTVPLTDIISVIRATVVPFDVAGTLFMPRGPDPTLLQTQAVAAIRKYGAGVYRIGGAARMAGIVAAGMVGGASNLVLTEPAADVLCDGTKIPWLRNVTIASQVV
jgi:phage-related baseplate assembly protein